VANNEIPEKTEEQKKQLDDQIESERRVTDSDIREYPLSVITQKFTEGLKTDEAEIFVPDYQREFVWSHDQQSKFIESLLLNLPIPYIFVADVGEGDDAGRVEIIDGSQRVRSIVSFLTNELRLQNLKKITTANEMIFSDFSRPTQLRFGRKTIRMIELSQYANEDTRREIFDRLNSGGLNLVHMEQRRGVEDGPFLTFVERLSENEAFRRVCPLSAARVRRAEYPELVLRFFAYNDKYLEFTKSVSKFLTLYLQEKNLEFDEEGMEIQFGKMCTFVEQYFPYGFRKEKNHSTVPRIRFEALAVGAMLALEQSPELVPSNVNDWITSERFVFHTRSDASNSRPKVKGRIEYVRNMLLGVGEGEEI
jgi:hypothetical protein